MHLTSELRGILLDAGAIVPDYGSQIVTACFPGIDVSALSQRLEARKVHTSARHGALRVSAHFYNDENDLDCFRAILHEELYA
jgi:selenocysteine lyase/cysteine desulfurase